MPELEKERTNTGVLGAAWPHSLPDRAPHRALPSIALMPLPSIEKTYPSLQNGSAEGLGKQ